MAYFGTSNKFSVLQVQHPQQPKPKGDKLINSVAPTAPKKVAVSENDRQNDNNNNNNNNNNNRRGGENRGRGGNRGNRGGGRGGKPADRATLDKLRDPNQPPKRNKRIYDRNSNVPRNEVKKSGLGTGNWGTEKDVPRGLEDAKKENDNETPSENKAEGEQNNIIEEPEDKTITLKEYQEQLAALAPKIAVPQRREAGEGEKSDLHKYVILKKEEDDADLGLFVKPKKEKAKKNKKQQPKEVAVNDLLNVNNVEERRPRQNRPYNNNNNNKKPKKVNISIEDTDSFPALK